MKVYIKNVAQEQTVRELPFTHALWLRWKVFTMYAKKGRPIVRFLI
jgi:hypothetical protein